MSIRKGKYFPYGAKINGMKGLSKDKAIESMPAVDEVAICLSQHIGAPAIPVVNIGDKVKKGQIIGEASGFISANVYSSVAGTVTDIKDLPSTTGLMHKHIVIKNNFSDEEVFLPDLKNFEAQTIIDRIKDAGIVGLGGAGFPTFVKLSPTTPLDTLIVNGAECEPYLNCDYRLMIEKIDGIIKGIRYVSKALNIKKVIVGIESNKPDAIKIFSEQGFDVVELKKQYPMGSEKHLIYCCTGRKVPLGKIPLNIGCCVQNIKTLYAVYEAVEENKPLTEVYMTVSGGGINNPKNLKVAIGTPYKEIVSYCGGLKDGVVKQIVGGPMMGKAIYGLNHHIKKTDSGLLFLSGEEASVSNPTNCINCGKCAKNCPMRLMPMYIDFYTLAGDYENAKKYGALNCIECGSCAYNCPANRALVQSITLAKQKLKAKKN